MPSPAPPPPPGPEGAESWTDLTARLRALYEWCGTPKYRTLTGRVTGLSPAAISNLIGRNPLMRPPETASMRFVEACLRYRGHQDLDTEVARWQARWNVLAERQANAAENAASEQTQPSQQASDLTIPSFDQSEQGPRRTTAVHPVGLAAVAALVAMAAVAVVVVLTNGDKEPDKKPGPATETGAAPVSNSNAAATEPCRPINELHTDIRHKETWKHVFQCSNKPASPLYEHPRADVHVGVMETRRSWFACWVRGERHAGGNDIWYYTQGDRMTAKTELEGWGFMPASHVLAPEHPDPAVTRECSFN
ncbi:hypothetical protein SMC26_17705 [Actinomadura fulvescens]|uniref:XRE family transcriptional regulator n=1 Tax=Actinomadura fulvescens TaxID=46160 RepID=A0ABP6CEE6_9ACTN